MTTPHDKPALEEHHCNTLDQVLLNCGKTQSIIDKARASGIPVDQYHEANQTTATVAAEMRKQFFPHRH